VPYKNKLIFNKAKYFDVVDT